MNKMRTGALVAAVAAAFALMAGVAAAAEIVIKHKQGETALPAKPEKVLVFDLASLDTLAVLGIEVAGAPGRGKPDYLKGCNDDRYLKVGTLFEPDYETVNAAEPDLIIVARALGGKVSGAGKNRPHHRSFR